MSPLASLVASTLVALGGLWLAISGWSQPAPSLVRAIDRLHRDGPTVARSRRVGECLVVAAGRWDGRARFVPTGAQLRLAETSAERHVSHMLLAASVGFVGPPTVLVALQRNGLLGLGWPVPVAASLAGAVVGAVVVHGSMVDRAGRAASDLRYQVSAYLDLVTMLLAGNTGYEGALHQAALAGDGRLFVELRRRMRESGARGTSLTDALRLTGVELGLAELEQVAASAALSATEGAPVARTLAARCATLRNALATEQESEARLRTSRLTTPIVGMALIFMGLVIYPALTFS